MTETERMEIKSYRYKVKCVECNQEITGVTEKHLLSNLNTHLLLKHKDKREANEDATRTPETS